ncbi:hypothetical protein [Streptomyces sp. NPDC050428]|uniref:hypothetical protein n=1 Tax=Streptomyces sp. NPDC050428 TaxID=3155757 RepID=UPI0034471019
MAWDAIERELQAELPIDYKELGEALGGGVFSGFVYLLCVDDGEVFDLIAQWRGYLNDAREHGADDDPIFAPYSVYEPGKQGIIPWGSTESGDEFYWLADDSAPEGWPIVARRADSMEWDRYEIGVPEFIMRVLTDPEFHPFTIAQDIDGPNFASVSELS